MSVKPITQDLHYPCIISQEKPAVSNSIQGVKCTLMTTHSHFKILIRFLCSILADRAMDLTDWGFIQLHKHWAQHFTKADSPKTAIPTAWLELASTHGTCIHPLSHKSEWSRGGPTFGFSCLKCKLLDLSSHSASDWSSSKVVGA